MIELLDCDTIWSRHRLDDLFEIRGGIPAPQDDAAFAAEGIPFVRMKDVGREHFTRALARTDSSLAQEYFNSRKLEVVPDGSILMPRSGSVGLNHRALLVRPAVIVSHLCAVVPRNGEIDPAFAYYLFCQMDMRKLTKKTTGLDSINFSDLRDVAIPLPPFDEQRRIAAILDQVDDVRRKRREALEQLDRLSWANFFKSFGDPERNPFGFPVVTFGDLIIDGPTNGLYKPASAYGSGTPILRINNFYDGRVESLGILRRLQVTDAEARTYALNQSDIVINRVNSREFLGKCALIPALQEPTVFESNMMRLRVDSSRLDPVFCITLLQTDFIRRQIVRRTKDAVNQSSINQSDVRSFRLIVPPVALQRAFAARVAEIDALKAQHRAHLAKLDALFASLQHRAFRGEL